MPKDAELKQLVTVPGSATVTLTTPATQEAVAGGSAITPRSALHTLSKYIDDVTRDFGPSLYDKMLYDSVISSTLNIRKMGVLADGPTFMPSLVDSDTLPSDTPTRLHYDPYDKAKEISDFVNRAIVYMDSPLSQTLFECLDCYASGYTIAEQTWQYAPKDTPDSGKLVLKNLKVKSHESTAMVVDNYMNIVAILGQKPGGMSLISAGTFLTPDGLKLLDYVYPREKFFILSHRPRYNDPRGTSILRPCYSPWLLKMQTWNDWLKYLAQFASPFLVMILHPDATTGYLRDANGNLVVDANNKPIFSDPMAEASQTMATAANGTYIIVRNGAKVEAIHVQSDGRPFLNAVSVGNNEIRIAVLGQTLTTSEGEHMSRAASATHQDTQGMIFATDRTWICDALAQDIARPLVLFNYGPDYLWLTPRATLGTTEQQDFSKNASAVAALKTSGYLTDDQLPGMDEFLSIPIRASAPSPEAQVEDNAFPAVPVPSVSGTSQPANPQPAIASRNKAGQGQETVDVQVIPQGNPGANP